MVFEAEGGRVVGFSGGLVRKLSIRGRLIRVGFGGNLVFHPEFRSGKAVPRLIETFWGQDSDLAVVDSANDVARKLLLRNGFCLIPALNLHWRRPLLPVHYAIYGLAHSMKPLFSAGIYLAAKPVCWLADSVAARFSVSPLYPGKCSLHAAELDADTLLTCLLDFHTDYSASTQYDLHSLQWLLTFMQRRKARGTLRKIVLRDDNNKIVGWYIYYVKRGAVGEVVQIGGAPDSTQRILDHLFRDAAEQGILGLHGVLEMRRMVDFSEKHCFFTGRGGWTMARSKDPALLKLFEDDTFFTRLDGEWCLDPGD
jgi:hypothetical protein